MLHTDLVIESTNDYYTHQSKHYEAHREEEDYPQLWEEICKYWTENITGTKNMSSKVMVGQVMSCRDTFTRAVTIFSSSCLFFRLNPYTGANLVQYQGHSHIWMCHLQWKWWGHVSGSGHHRWLHVMYGAGQWKADRCCQIIGLPYHGHQVSTIYYWYSWQWPILF